MAVILPQMRNQCTNLVQDDATGHHAEEYQKSPHWNDVRRDHGKQSNGPDTGSDFASQPAPLEVPFRRFATKIRVDDQTGIALNHDPAQRRNDRRKR